MFETLSIQQIFNQMKKKGTEVAGPFTWGQLLDRYPTYAKVNKILCDAIGIPDFNRSETFEIPVAYLDAIVSFETAKSIDDILELYKVMCSVLVDSLGDVYADGMGLDDHARSATKNQIQFTVMSFYPKIDTALKQELVLN